MADYPADITGLQRLMVAAQDNPVSAKEDKGTNVTGIFKDVARALMGGALGFSASDPTNPRANFAAQQLGEMQARRATAQQVKKANELFHQMGVVPESVTVPESLIEPIAKRLLGTQGKYTRVGPNTYIDPQGVEHTVPGVVKPLTNEVAIRQAFAANPNDPEAQRAMQALTAANQGKMDRAIAGATGKAEALKATKTIGDTKEVWFDRNTGLKLPSSTPIPAAQSQGTRLSPQEAKMYEGTQELLGWMGELGVTPDGQITPEGQATFDKLYARKPGIFSILKAGGKRKLAELSGDPDAQKLDQVISILTTQFAKATAGTLRVNQSELRLIKAAHPGPTDTAQTAVEKLRRITRYAVAIRNRMLKGMPPPTNDMPPFLDLQDVPHAIVPGSVPLPGYIPPERAKVFGD